MTFWQWLIRLLGDIPEKVSTGHVRSHQIVGVYIIEALKHFKYVWTARVCYFLEDAQFLKLLMIFVEDGANELFAYFFDGYLLTREFVLARKHLSKAALPYLSK